jgi:hypothetical protein
VALRVVEATHHADARSARQEQYTSAPAVIVAPGGGERAHPGKSRGPFEMIGFYWAGGGVLESALTVIELRTLNAVSVLR